MFVVLQEKKIDGTKIFYSLARVEEGKSDGTIFGRVIVNNHRRKSYWTYHTKAGAPIRDKLTRRRMSDAVHRYLDDTHR